MPKLTDQQLANLIDAGATDEEILALSQEAEAAPEESGMGAGVGAVLAGGAALAAGLAAKKYGAGKVFDTLNNVRLQGMLTGLAVPKSLLGNLGAGITTSIEEGSLAPLKEMLRLPTNVKSAYNAFKQGATYQGQPTSAWALPGRILGATDEAAQAALGRAGIAPEEAAKTMLQSEVDMGPQIRSALNTRAGQYLIPFRRTPMNQAIGALETISDWGTPGKAAANAVALGSGFGTGYETEGKGPTVAGTALLGRRGLPFAGAALLGRLAAGGTGRDAADLMQGASPVSDYSITQGIAGPFSANPIPKPALWNLLFGKE
jgi:hypothetical protein